MVQIDDRIIAFIGQKGIPKDFPGTSGIEAYVENRMIFLVKKGKIIRSYGRRWVPSKTGRTYKGIELISTPTINTKFLDTLTYSLVATLHASVSDASLIWYQGIGPSFFSFIPKIMGKKVFTTVHSLDWKRKKWNIFGKFFLFLSEHIAVRFSDRLFVVSGQLDTYYRRRYSIVPIVDKHTIIHRNPVKPVMISKKYNLYRENYILYMGRFVPEKRLEWLIHAVKNIQSYKLVLAGGSSHTDSYVKFLKSLDDAKKVRFIDYVFGREKQELLSNCRLFVLPSSLEGYPIVITEALGYQRPCLIGDFLKKEYEADSLPLYFFRSNSYKSFYVILRHILNNLHR